MRPLTAKQAQQDLQQALRIMLMYDPDYVVPSTLMDVDELDSIEPRSFPPDEQSAAPEGDDGPIDSDDSPSGAG